MSVNNSFIPAGCPMELENVSLEARHMELMEMLNDMPYQDCSHGLNTDDPTCTNPNMCVESEMNEEIERLVNSFVNPELIEEVGKIIDTSVKAYCREERSVKTEKICQDEILYSDCELNVGDAIMTNIEADDQTEIENVPFKIPCNVSIDVSSSSWKSFTENVYHQSDSPGLFEEVSQNSDIVEIRNICLPVTILKPTTPIQYSKSSMIDPERNESYVEPNEPIPTGGTDNDFVPALDELAALLGEPPRKKTVWDQFDLITKNLRFAEHLEENDLIKSAETGATLVKTLPHSCKRNALKKTANKNVLFKMPGKPHILPSRYCNGDSLRKETVKTTTVGKRLNFELIKRKCEIPNGGKCVKEVLLSNSSTKSNIGKIIESACRGNNNIKTKVSKCTKTKNSDENKSPFPNISKKKMTSQLIISSTTPTYSFGSENLNESGAKATPQQIIKSCDPCSYKNTLNRMEVCQQYPTLQPRLVFAGYSSAQVGSCQASVDLDLTQDSP